MKTLIKTVAAFATLATLSVAPAMAENSVAEQRAKLQSIFAAQRGAHNATTYTGVAAKKGTADRVISTRMLTSVEKAQARLARVQPDAALGGR